MKDVKNIGGNDRSSKSSSKHTEDPIDHEDDFGQHGRLGGLDTLHAFKANALIDEAIYPEEIVTTLLHLIPGE